jgi:predicted nucleic acid-binding protein
VDVYVESNFVLELVYEQEEVAAARGLLSLGEDGAIALALPAFAVAEPLSTIRNRAVRRRQLVSALSGELAELRRSESIRAAAEEAESVELLLAEIEQTQLTDFETVVIRVASAARILPILHEGLSLAFEVQRELALELTDALIVGAVLQDLPGRAGESCFLTQDQTLASPRVRERLGAAGCTTIPSLANGLEFVRARV